MKTVRFFALGIALTLACAGWSEVYGYNGKVGAMPAFLNIEWPKGSGTRVGYRVGAELTIDDESYQLIGKNQSAGRVAFSVYRAGVRVGALRLMRKKGSKGVWIGDFYPKYGKRVDVKFTAVSEDCGC